MSLQDRIKYIDKILDTNDMVLGEIYVITNLINGKRYVGQALSHRLNHGKYRPFGHAKRLKDHISEAICDSKKKQCTFLNNAIRKYGADSFKVDLIERCLPEDTNDVEIKYIAEYNTLFPNGYNLTVGGRRGTTLIEHRVKAMENTYKQYEQSKLDKFKKVAHLIKVNDIDSYIREYTSYGQIYYKIIVHGVNCIFFGQHLNNEELKQKAKDFLLTVVNQHLATGSNCGNLLKPSDTTSLEKSLEGTRVMTGSNGNNSDDGTIRSQAPKIKVKLRSKAT
jgi:hypothetical protein